jgi:poly(A)-specific ribonuclease
MDIRPPEFQTRLPSILDAIASAHFITLDLELSGIPGQQLNRPRAVGEALTTGKPLLQQRYEETKAAAEKYQVLQFGITCVDENKDRG